MQTLRMRRHGRAHSSSFPSFMCLTQLCPCVLHPNPWFTPFLYSLFCVYFGKVFPLTSCHITAQSSGLTSLNLLNSTFTKGKPLFDHHEKQSFYRIQLQENVNCEQDGPFPIFSQFSLAGTAQIYPLPSQFAAGPWSLASGSQFDL